MLTDDTFDNSDTDYAELEFSTRETLDDQDRAELDQDEQDDDRAEYEQLARLMFWEPRRADESIPRYGARVLQHLIACAITAPLSDEDLELANHAAIAAVAHHDISPAAVDAINRAKHLIAAMLRARAADRDAALATLPPVIDDTPNQGPMAKLQPAPIVQPPSPARVKPDFSF